MKVHLTIQLLLLAATMLTGCASTQKETRPLTATVVVGFVVNEQGNVESDWIVSSTDMTLNKVALDGVKKWQFKPGIKNGRPAKANMEVPIVFDVK
jgi:TonB family protein